MTIFQRVESILENSLMSNFRRLILFWIYFEDLGTYFFDLVPVSRLTGSFWDLLRGFRDRFRTTQHFSRPTSKIWRPFQHYSTLFGVYFEDLDTVTERVSPFRDLLQGSGDRFITTPLVFESTSKIRRPFSESSAFFGKKFYDPTTVSDWLNLFQS